MAVEVGPPPLPPIHTFANKTSWRKVRRAGDRVEAASFQTAQLRRHLLPKCSLTPVMPFIPDTLHNAIGAEKAALACEQLSARRAAPGSRCEAGNAGVSEGRSRLEARRERREEPSGRWSKLNLAVRCAESDVRVFGVDGGWRNRNSAASC